ncbi:MAG: hypothetical protein EXR72_05885 [Myxococcales bacterium]|nr:hypothetical protein [Myxococcales bacterium]
MLAGMPDRHERLDFAERWLADGFRVLEPPGGFALVEVDMTRARALLARLRESGVKATYNHIVVRAAALALARKPELHVLVAGTRRLRPERVDIGLSVAGRTNFAPVMRIEGAGEKKLPELAAEVIRRIPEVQAKEEVDLAGMRRWGWLIPLGWLRRALLGLLFSSLWFRRKLTGTFQITCLPVDAVAPFTFTSAGCLGVGRVADRVIAVDGQPAVRPMVTLICAFDHKAWDGSRLASFSSEVKRILEEGELEGEVG